MMNSAIETIEGIELEIINEEKHKGDKPLLTVYCLTYNHSESIKKCFKGILDQKVNFKYEVIVFDDASTDGTTDIVREYCTMYPKIFRAFIVLKNTYKDSRRVQLLQKLGESFFKGDYIAFCEGDDYWCDSDKLQIQVDFLENNPDYILTLHDGIRHNMKTGIEETMKGGKTRELYPEEIIMQYDGAWPTASMVGRRNIYYESSFLKNYGIGDWPVQLFASANGRIYYFNLKMCVYNYLNKNSWSERTLYNKKNNVEHVFNMIKLLNELDKYTNGRFINITLDKRALLISTLFPLFRTNKDEFVDIIKTSSVSDAYKKLLGDIKDCIEQGKKYNYICDSANMEKYNGKKVYVYCASEAGLRATILLDVNKINVEKYIDSNFEKVGTIFNEKPVCGFEELIDVEDEYVVQIGSLDYELEISQRLETNHIPHIMAHDLYISFFKKYALMMSTDEISFML